MLAFSWIELSSVVLKIYCYFANVFLFWAHESKSSAFRSQMSAYGDRYTNHKNLWQSSEEWRKWRDLDIFREIGLTCDPYIYLYSVYFVYLSTKITIICIKSNQLYLRVVFYMKIMSNLSKNIEKYSH